jgi:hypothetical protein
MPQLLYHWEKSPGTPCTGGWVHLGAGLDLCGKSCLCWCLNPALSGLQWTPILTKRYRNTDKCKIRVSNVYIAAKAMIFTGEWMCLAWCKGVGAWLLSVGAAGGLCWWEWQTLVLLQPIDWKHQAFQVVCSHLAQNLTHAYLSHFCEGSSWWWTVDLYRVFVWSFTVKFDAII